MSIIFGGDAGITQNSYLLFSSEIANRVSQLVDIYKERWNPEVLIPSKERIFVDDGFSNVPGTSFIDSKIENVDDMKERRITSQRPDVTVYVKKRAFWSLVSSNNSKYMDPGEKLFMRATKILFEKKCNQIAAYEALTKAEKLLDEDALLDADRTDRLIAAFKSARKNIDSSIEAAKDNFASGTYPSIEARREAAYALEDQISKIKENYRLEEINEILASLRQLSIRQKQLSRATNTNWVIDTESPDLMSMGRGVGVIELTSISNISTSLSVDGDLGDISFTIEDPYNLTKITSDDVEVALSSAYSEANNLLAIDSSKKNYAALRGPSTILEEAREKEEKLKSIRANRISSNFGIPRASINASKIPEIIFEIRPGSYSSDKVVAYTTSSPSPVYDFENLQLSMIQLPAEQQLTYEETGLVREIFLLLNQYVEAVERLNVSIEGINKDPDVKYARRQLRMHYLGKSIVQPMDSVHVYMRGNTFKDGEVVGPLSSFLNGSAFIGNFSNDRKTSEAIIKAKIKNLGLEKILTEDLYKSIISSSFMSNAGMHVFGGLIGAVTESYNASNGTYTLKVSGKSNLRWLQLSRVNTEPGLDQPQGFLEDPLTPFSFEVDPATGLLKPGKSRLLPANAEAIKDKKLRDKTGVHRGKLLTEINMIQDLVPIEGDQQPVWQHTPGLVYKWKPGVAVAALDLNLARSISGKEEATKALQRWVGLTITSNVFAGLDAADIISLLTTGYPHSPQRFYNSAISVGNLSSPGNNASPSYFHSFFDLTRSTNRALGNFKPFRSVNFEGTKLAQQVLLQGTLFKSYKKLDSLRSQLAEKQDKLRLLSFLSETNNTSDNEQRSRLKKGLEVQRDDLKKAINDETNRITSTKEQAKADKIMSNTDTIAFDLNGYPSGIESDAGKEKSSEVRIRNLLLQFRSQYDCKFNRDENLMIIADEYNNNVDIQAFITELRNGDQKLFDSSYKYPYEICQEVAKTLDFEFMCDTQGHLVFRPQQYNKVPLSLILKMFLLNENNHVQLYPDFLKFLFESRKEANENEVDALGYQIEQLASILQLTEVNPDKLTSVVLDGITEDPLSDRKYKSSNDQYYVLKGENKLNRIVELGNLLAQETGRKNNYQDPKFVHDEIVKHSDPQSPDVNVNRLNTYKKLRSMISKRQKLKTLAKKFESQGASYTISSADFNKENINNLLAPFENMIEDDYNDLIGPGSSKRFIIYDDQIISYEFTESDQNAQCRFDVQGQENLVGRPGEIVPDIPSIWAGGTDFDMWRMYGYRPSTTVVKPFLKNAEAQCAPYVLFLLSRARRDIVRGRITVYGNEFYQLGDVVYINSRDTLFYVTGISHRFDYNAGSFTTELTLRYGRVLGEYIPTPFDVIGKAIVKNQSNFNKKVVNRQTSSKYNGVHLGLVVFEDEESSDERKAMLTEPHSMFNVAELKRALLVASNYAKSEKSAFPKVEVLGWYYDEANKSKVEKRMDTVIKWLKNPMGRWIENEYRYIKIDDIYYDSALNENQIHNLVLKNPGDKAGGEPIVPINLNEDLSGDDLKYNRLPGEEVYNILFDKKNDPTNVIEIVLVFEEQK